MLVECCAVDKSFVKTGSVFKSLNLSIPEGQFVCLLGPSGCGKSTLLRMIAGLEEADAGKVIVRARSIAYVFQEPLLLPWRTAAENVMLPLELSSRHKDGNPPAAREEMRVKARQALFAVGLGEALDKRPSELSGGMKMRASLARALVVQPDLLLLDEPFAALDEVTRFHLQDDLLSYWRSYQMTVVFVTHSISEAAYLSQRQIVFSKRPVQVLSDRKSLLEDVRAYNQRFSESFLIKHAAEVKTLQGLFRAEE